MAKKILVIDDDTVDMKRIMALLEREGYVVTGASHADEALLKEQAKNVDLVIVDVVTDESNTTGFDICRKIKTVLQPKPPRVLMVTGNPLGVNVALAKQMGADGFEVKTSDMKHVAPAVRSLLSSEATEL